MSQNEIRDLAERVLRDHTGPMTLADLFRAMVQESPELAAYWTLPGRGLGHLLKGDKTKRFRRVGVAGVALGAAEDRGTR